MQSVPIRYTMVRRLLIIIFQIVFCQNSFALTGEYYYTIKKNEYASKVLYRAGLKPLYKKQGTLYELIQSNKSNIKNIDFIEQGQKLYFSAKQVEYAQNLGLVKISSNNEITFTELAYQIEREKKLEKIAQSKTANNFVTNENAETTINRTVASENVIRSDKPEDADRDTVVENKINNPQETKGLVESKTDRNKVAESESETVQSGFELAAGAGYSSLNGKDRNDNTTAQILSKLNYNLTVSWNQHWSETTTTRFYVDYKSHSFDSQYLNTKIYDYKIETHRLGFAFIDLYKIWDIPFKYNLNIDYGTNVFYRGINGVTGSGLEINAVPMSAVAFGFEKSIFNKNRFDIGFNVSAQYYSSGTYQNYNVRSGYGYGVGLYLNEKRVNNEFGCGLNYSQRKQDSSLIYFTETIIGSMCHFEWRY